MPCLFCLNAPCAQCALGNVVTYAANDNVAPADRIVNVPSDDVLKRPSVYHRLAIVYKSFGIKRTELPVPVNEVLHNFAGEAFDQNAIYIELLLIDANDLLWPDSDPSGRLIDDFYAVADAMPKQQTQNRVLPRIRLLWLALAIACPQLAARIIQ
jgi:hypothetical protein